MGEWSIFGVSVKPKFTHDNKNILKVNSKKEIFFDVFECTYNGNNIIAQKIGEDEGLPIIQFEVLNGNNKHICEAILVEDKECNFYVNENNLQFIKKIKKPEKVKTLIKEEVEKIIPVNTVYENKARELSQKIILESEEKARKLYNSRLKEYKNSKQLVAKQAEQYLNEKSESIKRELHEQYIDFLSNNSENVKKIIRDNIDGILSTIDENKNYILNKIENLSGSNKQEFLKILSENINIINSNIDSKIEDLNEELKVIIRDNDAKIDKFEGKTSHLFENNIKRVDSIEKNIKSKIKKIDEKIEDYKIDTIKHIVEKVAENKSEIKESLERTISEINSQFDLKKDEVEKILTLELSNINEKLNIFSEEEDKKYKQLLENLNDLNKGEIKEILSEKLNDKQLNALKLDISKQFQNEMMSIKRLVEMSSGGGSVAKQFANGGTMDGDLNVNGTITAETILATNLLSATNLDIGYELSGFNVTGSISAAGNLSAYDIYSNGDVTIIGSINTVDSIQFDTAAGVTVGQGQLAWNSEDLTLDLGLDTEVTLQVGQEQVLRVKCADEDGVFDGMPVYASSTTGGSDNIEVSRFSASSASGVDELYFVGIATEDIVHNGIGFVTTFGKVREVDGRAYGTGNGVKDPADTGDWEFGDILWVSPNVAGTLTTIKPSAPNRRMAVAMVLKAPNQQNITLMVRAEHGYHLDEIHDVRYTNLQNNDLLSYNSTDEVWENKSLSAIADSTYVNQTGNETISGIKTFLNEIVGDISGDADTVDGYHLDQDVLTTSSPAFSGLAVDTDVLYVDSTNNRVGIGTDSPDEELHVVGTGKFRKTETSQQNNVLKVLSTEDASSSDGNWRGRALFGADNTTLLMGVYRGAATLGAHNWASANTETGAAWADLYLNPDGNKKVYIGASGFNPSTAILTVDNATDRVGIGTDSPDDVLHVVGDTRVDGSLNLIDQSLGAIKEIVASANNLTFDSVHGIFGYSLGLRNKRGSVLGFESDGTDLDINAPGDITLTNSGNVGIGTISPSDKLHIADGGVYVDVDTPTSNTNYFVVGNSWPTQLNFGLGKGTSNDLNNPNTFLKFGSSEIKEVAALGLVLKSGGTNIYSEDNFVPSINNNYSLGTSARKWNQIIIGSGDSSFDGNVGIGTDSPDAKLDIEGEALRGADNNTDTTNKEFNVTVGHYTNAEQDLLAFRGISTNSTSLIAFGGGDSNYNAANQLRFYTASNTTTTLGTERMRIDSSGNVGIGTNSPTYKLDVETTDDEIARFVTSNQFARATIQTTASNGFSQLNFGTDNAFNSAFFINYATGGAVPNTFAIKNNYGGIQLFTGTGGSSDSQFTLDSDGNVGIGTNSPDAKLKLIVEGDGDGVNIENTQSGISAASAGFNLFNNLGGQGAFFKLYSSNNTVNSDLNNVVYAKNSVGGFRWVANTGSSIGFGVGTNVSSANDLVIDSSGNVGIGTSSPTEALDVNGNILTNGQIGVGLTPDAGIDIHIQSEDARFLVENTLAGGEWIRFSAGTVASSMKWSNTGGFGFKAVTSKTDTSLADTFYITSSNDIMFGGTSPDTGFTSAVTSNFTQNVGFFGITNPSYSIHGTGEIRMEDGTINVYPNDGSAADSIGNSALNNIITASSGAGTNVGLWVAQAITSGTSSSQAYGLNAFAYVENAANLSGNPSGGIQFNTVGGRYATRVEDTAQVNSAAGASAYVDHRGSGTMTNAFGLLNEPNYVDTSLTITNSYGLYVSNGTGSGTITNQYGLYVENLTKGTSNWGVYVDGTADSYFGGNVGIGTTTPSEKLDVNGNIKADNFRRIGFAAANSTTSMAAGNWTAVTFTSEIEDTDTAFNGTTFTVPTGEGGMYSISGMFTFNSVTDGNRYIVGIEINPSGAIAPDYLFGRGTAGSTNLQGVGGNLKVNLNAGDVVRMIVFCDNATSGYNQNGYQSFSAYKMLGG